MIFSSLQRCKGIAGPIISSRNGIAVGTFRLLSSDAVEADYLPVQRASLVLSVRYRSYSLIPLSQRPLALPVPWSLPALSSMIAIAFVVLPIR
jgi:hypothetical protein